MGQGGEKRAEARGEGRGGRGGGSGGTMGHLSNTGWQQRHYAKRTKFFQKKLRIQLANRQSSLECLIQCVSASHCSRVPYGAYEPSQLHTG